METLLQKQNFSEYFLFISQFYFNFCAYKRWYVCYWQCCFNIKEFICLDSILQQSSSEISPTQETGMIHFTGTSFTIVILKALQKINCRHDLLTYIMRRSHWLNTDALRYLTTSRHTDTSFLNTTSQDGNLPVNVLLNCL